MSNEHDERLMEARTLNVTGLRLRDTNDTGDGMTLEGVAVPSISDMRCSVITPR